MNEIKIELINTIEINPFDYSSADYEYPSSNSEDFLEERERFRKKCLSDKNLENLKAIKKGSDLVDINSIKNFELKEILKKELSDVDLDDYEEQVGIICGGIVLKAGAEFLIEPSCCGDIGNLSEWEVIFVEPSHDWKQLWIGHPWVYYRMVKDEIEFSDYYEVNIDDVANVKSIFMVSREELKNKIGVIRQEQNYFEIRIQNLLQEMGVKNSKRIAKLMTGN